MCCTNPARYCPHASVTRGEMATFLSRAIEFFPERTPIGEGEETAVLSVELGSPSSAVVTGFVRGGDHVFSTGHRVRAKAHSSVQRPCYRFDRLWRRCYTATIAPATDGTVVVWVPADVVSGDGSNTNRASGALSRTYTSDPGQTDQLSVELRSSTEQVVTGSFEVEVTFARPVTGFVAGDIAVSNGRATGLTGSGAVYRTTIIPTSVGTVVVQIPASAARDDAGDPNLPSQRLVRTFEPDPGQADPLSVESRFADGAGCDRFF